MPIKYYPKEQAWKVVNPTPEEQKALYEIGKMMVIQGLAGAYTNERYQSHLKNAELSTFWRA